MHTYYALLLSKAAGARAYVDVQHRILFYVYHGCTCELYRTDSIHLQGKGSLKGVELEYILCAQGALGARFTGARVLQNLARETTAGFGFQYEGSMHPHDIDPFPVIASDNLYPRPGRVLHTTRVVHKRGTYACADRDLYAG